MTKFINFLYQPIKYFREKYNSVTITPVVIFNMLLTYFNAIKSPPSFLYSDSSNKTENWLNQENWWVFMLFIIVFFFVAFYICLFLILLFKKVKDIIFETYIARKGYGKAIISLQKAFSEINIIKSKNKNSADELKKGLIDMCTYVKDIYKIKHSDGEFSTSIKLIQNPISFDDRSSDLEVITIIRDNDWGGVRRDKNYDEHIHIIGDNTCFRKVIHKYKHKLWDSAFYINNFICENDGYESSSLDVKQNMIAQLNQKKWNENPKYRCKNWVLAYKSEIVLPIIPSKNQEEYFLLGFLCVDSSLGKDNIFNEAFDVPLLKGVADGIYDIIWKNHDLLYKKY